jgi:hypothetical protein
MNIAVMPEGEFLLEKFHLWGVNSKDNSVIVRAAGKTAIFTAHVILDGELKTLTKTLHPTL